MGYSAVAALALVLPVSLTASALRTGPERAVEVSVAGPAPAGGMAALPATITPIEPEAGTLDPPAVTAELPPPPVAPSPTTTTTEVPRRVATINGAVEPAPPTSVPSADDPVVQRPTTTLAPAASTLAAGAPNSNSTPPVTAQPTEPWCPFDDVRATVVTDKSMYATGETVQGTSTLQNRGTTTCVLVFDVIISVRNSAGRAVDFLKVVDFKKAAKVEPGQTFTSSFTWDQKDCASVVVDVYPTPRDRCAQVPPGVYTATDGSAQDSVPGSFQIGA
jgi:hypothetical protein